MSSYLPRGVNRPHDPANQLEFVRGEGCYLWDKDGNRYLDFVSGYSSLVFGHSHPRLVAAAKDQLDKLVHVVGWNHPWRSQLAERLAQIAPVQQPARVWISTTGARAIEIAWKIAFANRPGAIVSFDYAYHGRSIATSQITNTNSIDIPLPQSIKRIDAGNRSPISLPVLPYPTCEDCPLGLNRSSCAAECFDESEAWLRTHQKGISAVIVEPALGARGYYFAADPFFHRLRKITFDLGILLIDDEIQMGLGRLGSMFAASQQGWEPDMVVLGKSLGGGLVNVSAVIGPDKLMNTLPPGVESETFAADPLACRIALEALDVFEHELQPHLFILSEALETGVCRLHSELKKRFPVHCFQVDSQGCAAVIQVLPETFGSETHVESSYTSIAETWTQNALENGLLVHWSGKRRDRIVMIPPLVASQEMVKHAIDILVASLPTESQIHLATGLLVGRLGQSTVPIGIRRPT